MKTLALFAGPGLVIPASTAWYLDTLGEFRGKQELYTRQSPQKLKVLREHALIESAVSSNRIEGVSLEASRIQSVLVATKPLFRDRDEEEIRGYRDALAWIHEHSRDVALDESALERMHSMARGQIWDAGQYKERDGDIVQRYADGQERVRFKPTPANETAAAMAKLIDTWNQCLKEKWAPPAVALAAFNLDFLCIHPFRDGNGRVSRVALLLQVYQAGMEVGRAYQEFEERVGQIAEPKGAKAELVRTAVRKRRGEFRLSDIEHACPGVGREWIRTVLADMRKDGELECKGRGVAARWSVRPKQS